MYINRDILFYNIYRFASFNYLKLSTAIVDPASEFYASAIILSPIARNKKMWLCDNFQ